MLAKFIILVAILALIKPAVSIDVSPRAVNLDHDLCLGEAKLYRECGKNNVVAAVSKKKNAGFESVKDFGAMAIDIPQGCKATLYNEKVRFAVHITGPKLYCSQKELNGIDIVGLQDVADVEMVAAELVKTEQAFADFKADMKTFKRNILENLYHTKKMRGATGTTGATGIAIKGDKGPRGLHGDRGLQGDRGAQGPAGPQGDRGVQGPAGLKGDRGLRGENGQHGRAVPGPKGREGLAGVGFTFKTFALRKDFVKGDYVITTGTDPRGKSMFIAETGFTALKQPKDDLNGHWIEFVAPRGENGKNGESIRGPQGEKGDKGDKGVKGNDAVRVL
jgi:hypothetical protein